MNSEIVGASRGAKRLAAALLLIDVWITLPVPSSAYPITGLNYWASATGGLVGGAFLVYILYLVARRIFQKRSWAYGLNVALIAHFFIAIIIKGLLLSK